MYHKVARAKRCVGHLFPVRGPCDIGATLQGVGFARRPCAFQMEDKSSRHYQDRQECVILGTTHAYPAQVIQHTLWRMASAAKHVKHPPSTRTANSLESPIGRHGVGAWLADFVSVAQGLKWHQAIRHHHQRCPKEDSHKDPSRQGYVPGEDPSCTAQHFGAQLIPRNIRAPHGELTGDWCWTQAGPVAASRVDWHARPHADVPRHAFQEMNGIIMIMQSCIDHDLFASRRARAASVMTYLPRDEPGRP